MGRFYELISYEEAVSRIRKTEWRHLETERVEPSSSLGRISSANIVAGEDVPEWNRSLVDGYALRSLDSKGASETNPISLEINGIVEAGSSSYNGFLENHCTEIYTGGLLPSEYDSVVMAEDVERVGNSVNILKSLRSWENVQKIGDDIKSNSEILSKSDFIRPWHISAMISSKVKYIQVFTKLKIGVLSTGNELFNGSEGYIPNTTLGIYLDYLKRPFLQAESVGVSHDTVEEIRQKIQDALEKYDCLIVTGGTSLGGKDEVPEAMSGIGNLVFAGSRIRPGRTLTLYKANGKAVFSVSGIPVPSLMSFDTYFEEFLKTLTGIKKYRQEVTGRLTSTVSNSAGYASIYRVKYSADSEEGTVDIIKAKGSGSLGSILDSNATLTLTGDKEGAPAGSLVKVKLLGGTP